MINIIHHGVSRDSKTRKSYNKSIQKKIRAYILIGTYVYIWYRHNNVTLLLFNII